jgi:hypothetical protein
MLAQVCEWLESPRLPGSHARSVRPIEKDEKTSCSIRGLTAHARRCGPSFIRALGSAELAAGSSSTCLRAFGDSQPSEKSKYRKRQA